MEGDDVKELQKCLIELDYDCGKWGADGDFGDTTELAVRAFQKDNNLTVDGKFGPASLAAMEEALADSSVTVVQQIKIVGGDCYVRDTGSTSGKILGAVRKNELYTYAGETNEAGWNKIVYNGSEGWVSGKYSKVS